MDTKNKSSIMSTTEAGKKGGKARWKGVSKEERSRIMSLAAKKMHARRKSLLKLKK